MFERIESNNLTDLWHNALVACLNFGQPLDSRDGESWEMIGTTLVLTDINKNFVVDAIRNASPIYANAELLWYLSGDPNIDMIKAYAPQYERFAENGVAHGAYGYRLMGSGGFVPAESRVAGKEIDWSFTQTRRHLNPLMQPKMRGQLDFVINLLKDKPNTRQAILQLWRDADLIHALAGDKKDLPCTLSVQFLLRDGSLHCIVNMRSNDLWLGTPYDIYCWSTIQRIIADAIGAKYGNYIHHVGSLHLYRRNEDKAIKVKDGLIPCDLGHNYLPVTLYAEHIARALEGEREARQGKFVLQRTRPSRYLLADVEALAGSKWFPEFKCVVHSPLLRDALKLTEGNSHGSNS